MKNCALSFLILVCVSAVANAQTLTPNLPEVAQCSGILTQTLVDRVTAAKADPAVEFETWRRSERTMMEVPPQVECQSKLWQALQRRSGLFNRATVPNETRGIGLQTTDPFATFHSGPFATTVNASVDPAGGVAAYQGEVQMAVNQTNGRQLVAAANTFHQDNIATCASPTGGVSRTYGTQALFGSSDGGATWTYQCAPWPPSLTGGSGAYYYYGSDPAVAWDANGNAYAAYMLLADGSAVTTAIVVAKSTDSGNSWTNLGTVVDHLSNPSLFDDKEMIAVDRTSGPASTLSHPGRLYVIWDTNNVENVAHSDDGVVWTTVTLPAPGFGLYDIGGNVVVGPDGTVYAIWNRLLWSSTQTGERIVFSKSTDGGNTWTTPISIVSTTLLSFGSNCFPPAQNYRGVNAFGSIDVDPNPASPTFGYLYVAYSDFPSGTTAGTDLNVYVLVSTNGGVSWSTPVKVNDDAGTATQFFPWLAVDPTDGSVNVAWYDTRNDPTLSQKTQIFYARSIDGAITFGANVPVTPNDTSTAWQNAVDYSNENNNTNRSANVNQYGDYAGIVAYNRQVHPVWTDSRQFFPTADTQVPSRYEDMGTSTIVNCGPPDAPAAPAVVGACGSASVQISWSAISNWGTNATGGTYSIFRSSSSTLSPNAVPIAAGLTGTTYTDTSGTPGAIYYYFAGARNNCSGTSLTPITSPSPASTAVVFPSSTANCAGVSGTVKVVGNAISGATVSAGGINATTDANGSYRLYGLAPGTYNVTASATGYTSSTASNITVANDAYVTEDFTLGIDGTPGCLTDTTQSDFAAGSGSNIDLATSAGDVRLAPTTATDQQQTTATASTMTVSTTSWAAQSFVAGASGALTSVDVQMLLTHTTGGTVTVEIRNDNGGKPGSTILATTSVAAFANASATQITATFTAPAVITSGTTYHIVVAEASGSGDYGIVTACASACDPYTAGTASLSTDSGATWTAQTTDLYFKTHVTTYAASGTLASTAKNSNPVLGADTDWTTLSWTATTPASTAVKFQVAASNSASGPFNFVGPDGTPSTYFTTPGASLSQFNGNQYLATKAFLSTSDGSVTPILNDVTACDSAVACSTPATPSISTSGSPSICTGGSVTLTSSSASGNQWYRGGVAIGGATGSSYVASTAGSYTVVVSLKGCTSNVSAPVVVTVTAYPSAKITLDATTVCAGSSQHTATVPDAGAGATYLWSITNGTIDSGAGTRSITYTAGTPTAQVTINATVTTGSICSTSSMATVSLTTVPTVPVISGSATWCSTGYFTLNSSASGATSYQWYLNGTAIAGAIYSYYSVSYPQQTNAGTYTVVAKNSCGSSAPSAGYAVTVTTMNTTVTASGPTTFCQGDSVTLTAAPGYTYSWSTGATTQSITVTQTGNYSVTISANGCSASSTWTYVSVTYTTPPAVIASGPTHICSGGSVTLSAQPGYTSYLWSSGETTQAITVKSAGTYAVTVTSLSGCKMTSPATTVTVGNPDATITPSGPTTFCSGGSVTLNAPSGSKIWYWYSSYSPTPTVGTPAFKVTVSGKYWLTVDDLQGCSATSPQITVTVAPVPETPTVNANGPTTFCQGASVTLTATTLVANPYTFLWSNGATTPSIVATTGGSYTVTITNSQGCSATSYPTAVTVEGPPPTPTLQADGPTTYCNSGRSTTLTASASPGQWYRNGVAIQGATTASYDPYQNGTYTFAAVTRCGTSFQSAPITITVLQSPPPPVIYGTPSIQPLCPGTPTTLTSTAASGNQWFKDGVAIAGATANTYNATTSGSYTVQATSGSCPSFPSAPARLTYMTPPSLGAAGSTNICPGGKVTLNASLANGYQWYLNGNLIAGAVSQSYNASQPGDYNVIEMLGNNCSVSTPKVTVTTSGAPSAAISVASSFLTGATVIASVADAGAGATYNWIVTDGTTASGATTRTLSFVAGAPGTCTLKATVTNASGCVDTRTVTLTVNAPLQILSIYPTVGPPAGGPSMSITGTGFVSGATVAIGGVSATNVVITSSTTLSVVIPPHALGTVDVVVTNPDGGSYPLHSSFTYREQQFDPNGDTVIDPSDIFYLINYLFTSGPAPAGKGGKIASGDANGDGVVDPSDIFYMVNYLFMAGPAPLAIPPPQPRRVATLSGSISLGAATLRDGKFVVPVIVDATGAQTISLKVLADGDIESMSIRRISTAKPTFEATRQSADSLSWLAAFGDRLTGSVAEIEIQPRGNAPITLELDPAVTTLGDRGGMVAATTANGRLQLRGTTISHRTPESSRTHE